ncbi:hypothetical protein SAMN04487776_1108 [Priestia megaterium]|nr:hypothetical protein SAMN04487776_1108 [Priestia megaterium]
MNTQKKIQKSQKNNIVFQGSGIVVPNLEVVPPSFWNFCILCKFQEGNGLFLSPLKTFKKVFDLF